MTKRKIAVVGSRTFPLPEVVWANLDLEQKAQAVVAGRAIVQRFVEHLTPREHVVISGGANGVDSWAAEFATERGITVIEMRANWKKHGKGAGLKRNSEIVLGSDDVIAFWDGQSKGTMDTIRKAHKMKRPYCVIGPDGAIKTAVTEDVYSEEASGE